MARRRARRPSTRYPRAAGSSRQTRRECVARGAYVRLVRQGPNSYPQAPSVNPSKTDIQGTPGSHLLARMCPNPMETGPGSAFERDVLAVLRSLRKGDMVTYGEVAREAGYPGRSRAVGALLSRGEHRVPWWRVVN